LKVLQKYIIREYIKTFSASLSVFISIYLIVDLFEKADEIAAHKAPFMVIIQFFVAKIPLIIFQVVPIAVLLSTVFILSTFSKNHELTAIKSCGVSYNQIIKPILLLGFLTCVLTFTANETILPWTNQIVKRNKRMMRGKTPLERLHKNRIWMRGGEDFFINIKHIDTDNKRMLGVVLHFIDDNFKTWKRVNAKSVEWKNGVWLFKDIYIRYFGEKQRVRFEEFREKEIDLKRDFGDFLYVKKGPDEMSYMELRTYIGTLRDNGYKSGKYLVDLYSKISIPFASFIMVLIAVPFSVRSPRSSSLSGVGICIGIGFVYWMFLSFGLSLGHKEAISPILGAWLGNVVFGSFALYLLRSKKLHFF